MALYQPPHVTCGVSPQQNNEVSKIVFGSLPTFSLFTCSAFISQSPVDAFLEHILYLFPH